MSRFLFAVIGFLWVSGRSNAFLLPHGTYCRQSARRRPAAARRMEDYEREEEEDDFPRTRYAGDSVEARELKNMRYQEEDDGYYYDDDEDYFYDRNDDEEVAGPRSAFADEDVEATGNFWSNPKPGFDFVPAERSRRTRRPPKRESQQRQRRPRPRGAPRPRTTFRSGAPKTPEPVADFYDRLFWYGFNPDDTISLADKTEFGGTKGKFNGLDFVRGERQDGPPQQRRRRKETPEHFRADEWYDDIMYSINENEELSGVEEDELSSETRIPRARRPLPPPEAEYYVDEEEDEDQYERRRRPRDSGRPSEGRRRRPPPERRPKGGDRIAREVSGWFGVDDNDNYGEEDDCDDRRRPRSRRKQKKDSFSVTNILDGLFRVDREEVDFNAAMYNRQMGLGKPTCSQRQTERRRGPGHAYPYREDDQGRPAVERTEPLDIHNVVDVDVVVEEEGKEDTKEQERRRERTIEERAAAFERVPPSGVPAWGPSGEVGVDARTKATLDALEKIREATRKVELREEQCIEAKEDIVVLKADFELQKKRLQASIDDAQRVRSRLRQMQMGIADASRYLRRCKAELEVARESLADLEDRHWALLSLYDADKAFQEVVETFREFEESERLSTRLEDDKDVNADTKSTEAGPDVPTESSNVDNEQPK